MFYQAFGDSSINFVIRFWISTPEQPAFLKAGNDAVMKIKKAYDENSITIPFPIRTLDFGIKRGATLAEMKSPLSEDKKNKVFNYGIILDTIIL